MIRPVGALLVALVIVSSVPAVAAAGTCSSRTVLTLVGLDSEAGTLLFATSREEGEPPLLIELRAATGTAVWGADLPDRFGGSSGAGPVLASRRCGEDCLQVLVWEGRWRPLGEPLLASSRGLVHLARDGGGTPWAVLQTGGGSPGLSGAVAYRFDTDWIAAGGLSVRAVGSPAVVADPSRSDAVVIGTGRFLAERVPDRWVEALPDVAGADRGQLRPVEGGAFYFAPDGRLFLGEQGRWSEVRWKPFVEGEGDLSWRPGREFWIELPEGEVAQPASAVWTDNRVAHRRRLYLTRWSPADGWKSLVDTPEGVLTEAGDRQPYSAVVKLAGEEWMLVLGCVSTAEGPVIAFRRVRDGRLEDPVLVPIEGEGVP